MKISPLFCSKVVGILCGNFIFISGNTRVHTVGIFVAVKKFLTEFCEIDLIFIFVRSGKHSSRAFPVRKFFLWSVFVRYHDLYPFSSSPRFGSRYFSVRTNPSPVSRSLLSGSKNTSNFVLTSTAFSEV